MKKNPLAFSHPLVKGDYIFERKKAFTLVELIIVITILAILATIAFVSFQGYTSSSRDSNRLMTITNISKSLDISLIQASILPIPDAPLELSLSGIVFAKQGYFGENVSRFLQITIPKDPNTKKEYFYSTDVSGKRYQLGGLFEKPAQTTFLPQTIANNQVYPRIFGTKIGLVLNTDNSPISGTGFDIYTQTGFKIISDNVGVTEKTFENIGLSNQTQYPGCPEKDISIPTQNGIMTLSACNIGATSTDVNAFSSWGNTYQWGNDFGFSLTGTVITSTNDQVFTGDIFDYGPQNPFSRNLYVRTTNSLGLQVHPHSWFSVLNGLPNQLWGANSNNFVDKKGPCAEGYHIPTSQEWRNLITAPIFLSYTGTLNQNQQLFFTSILKLPHTKYRNHGASLGAERGYYHVSDVLNRLNGKEWNTLNGYGGRASNVRFIHSKEVGETFISETFVAYSANIRCFKN